MKAFGKLPIAGLLICLSVVAGLSAAGSAHAAAFMVTNSNNSGPGSLRAAILAANAASDTDVISFSIPGAGSHTITLSGGLPAIQYPVTLDARTQPGYAGSPLIQLDNGTGNTSAVGLDVTAAGSKIYGLSITNFADGIRLRSGGGMTVAACWLGLDVSGAAAGNQSGVRVQDGSSGNVIGGTTPAARNVVSGNSGVGVEILGAGTTGNLVEGNYVGTNPAGTLPIGNDIRGVNIGSGAGGNTVGGTVVGARNVISGNPVDGVGLAGAGTGNVVEGNYIGTDANGAGSSFAVGNGSSGVLLLDSSGNTVGGTTVAARNLISLNGNGVTISGKSSQNVVAGNDIKNNRTRGVWIAGGAKGNTIGGGNWIVANDPGVLVSGSGTSNNVIQGNLIGTDRKGNTPVSNSDGGVVIDGGASNNTIGGTTPAARNVISGNAQFDVLLSDPGTSGNIVEGNYIGTDVTGSQAVAMFTAYPGVQVGGAGANTIGGTTAGARNVISGNGGSGVFVNGPTRVEGNYIGLDAAGTHTLPNAFGGGVDASGGATIGGTAPGAGNVISGNVGYGIKLCTGTVEGNLIGTGPSGTGSFGNTAGGIDVTCSPSTIGGTSPAAANTIAFNAGAGVAMESSAHGASVLGNSIASNYNLAIGDEESNPPPLPTITSVSTNGSTTTMHIDLTGFAPATQYRVETFLNPYSNCNYSQADFQGARFLGAATVTTDGTGNRSLSLAVPTLPSGQTVAATATSLSDDRTSMILGCAKTP